MEESITLSRLTEKKLPMGKEEGAPQGYLPTLNGWRAISIIAVIFCHDKIHSFGHASTTLLYTYGNKGVDVFFAISGLLICSRLLDEEKKAGTISIKRFYIRRVFRILPPALFYLSALLMLKWLIDLPVNYSEIVASLCFARNFSSALKIFGPSNQTTWYTGHFWSLAVEEHFYLFLPAFLVFVKSKRRASFLILFSALIVLHRFTNKVAYQEFHTDMRLDGLLFPAALSIQMRSRQFRERLLPLLRFWPLVLVVIAGIFYFGSSDKLDQTALAWLLPFVVLGTMMRPESLFGRFLELPVISYIGKLSYSLYLWQQLFFVSHYGVITPKIAFLQKWPWCLLSLIVCSVTSYYLIEQPMIKVGHRISNRVRTKSSSIGEQAGHGEPAAR